MTFVAGIPYTRPMLSSINQPTDQKNDSEQPDHWRNLLWTVSTPDIASNFPLPWLPADRRRDLYDFFSSAGVRSQLDSTLTETLSLLKSRRLGIYFEALWIFVFSHHPDYELLGHNIPIRAQGKTLGELDFVVRHIPDNVIEHWEVAVKFYLGVGDYWVGPGLRDRLDIKLARMRDHQLPIAKTPDAQSQLAQNQWIPQRQWALMPGRLFTPLPEAKSAPETPAYWWGTLSQFLEAFPRASGQWRLLRKRDWLAQPAASPVEATFTSEQLSSSLSDRLNARGPVCIEAVAKTQSRGFIVPASWYSEALTRISPPLNGH